jgi:dienelactone hydrolase
VSPPEIAARTPSTEGVPRRRPGRRGWWIALAAVLTLFGVAPLAASTRAVNGAVDRWTLGAMAGVALRAPPGPPGRPLPYTTAAELERLTRPTGPPIAVAIEPIRRFRMREPNLIQEVITFASAIPLEHPESNTARAYVYRHGSVGAHPVVVWVPGQYVVERAFVPIAWFTEQIVRRGADVVLLVPPYHLERTPAGYGSGDAVLSTNLPDHLAVYAQELSDLRRLLQWLRASGATIVGGFGGSTGAMMLLRIAGWDRTLDFLTVFIPMIRIGDVLDGPGGELMGRRLAKEGRSVAELQQIYRSLDPTTAPPRLDPARISVLYGRYDEVAPAATTLAWARDWGVTRLHAYDRGHTLALFTPSMYADYARLLDEDLRALGR